MAKVDRTFIDRRDKHLRRQGYDPDSLHFTTEMFRHPELIKEGVWVITKAGWVKKFSADKTGD